MEIVAASPTNSQLRKFFSAFHFSLITVSILPDSDNPKPRPFGKWFDSINWIRAIPFEEFFSLEVQYELEQLNSLGYSICFMVNEGDGVAHSLPKLNCGRRDNVKKLNCLVIDIDTPNSTALEAKLGQIKLYPHFINQTSPGKFHYYFIIKPVAAEGNNLLYQLSLQKLLADLIPNLDQSVNEENQVLRIPGFFNNKSKLSAPFKVRIKGAADLSEIPPYDLQELYERLGAYKYNSLQQEINGALNGNGHHNGNGKYTKPYKPFEFPKEKLTPGNRRPTITRYIDRLIENILPINAKEEEYFMHRNAFIKEYLKEEDHQEYLEGKAHENTADYLRDQLRFRHNKNEAHKTFVANQKFQDTDAVDTGLMPDEFYLKFPGDLGMLVREFHAYSPNMSLELCFASALMISGALKSEIFRYNSAWPFVNGLVIAGTGAGKSTLKDIVERTLEAAGLCGKYPQLFGFQNSVQSLHTALYTAGGSGTTIIDESGDYLETITSKNAPGYMKALKKYYKESTTGKDKGNTLHPGHSLSYSVPSIRGGMLSLWMLIQPDKFEGSLSLDDMADGFLPRFFTFNGKTNIKLTRFINEETGTKSFEPSPDLRAYLDSFIHILPAISVEAITEETTAKLKESMPKAKYDMVEAAKRDAVYLRRSEARKMQNIQVRITEEAKAFVNDYLKEREREAHLRQAKGGESDPSLGVYVRMEEMLMRLLCNAVSYDAGSKSAVIDRHLAEACIRFHRFNINRFFSKELTEMCKGSGEQEQERVLKALIKLYEKLPEGERKSVRAGDIVSAIKSTKRPKNITHILDAMIKAGLVGIENLQNKKHKKYTVPHYFPIQQDDNNEQEINNAI